MGGSSGSSGAIAYPSHIAWFQFDMMSSDGGGASEVAVLKPKFDGPVPTVGPNTGATVHSATMEALRAANIYTGVNTYDPDTDLTTFQTAVTRLTTMLDAMASETDWDTYVTNAIASVDEAIYTEAQKEEAVRNFRIKQQQDLSASYNRLTGAMNDINAVTGTGFLGGMAIIEAQFDNSVAQFRSAIEIDLAKSRVASTLDLLKTRIQGVMQNAQVQGDWARISITSQTEEIQENLKIDKDEQLWDLEIFQHTSNVFSAMGTGTALKSGQSSKGGALAAGLTGALSGAATGSAVPGIGTGVGAALGGLAGLAGGG